LEPRKCITVIAVGDKNSLGGRTKLVRIWPI